MNHCIFSNLKGFLNFKFQTYGDSDFHFITLSGNGNAFDDNNEDGDSYSDGSGCGDGNGIGNGYYGCYRETYGSIISKIFSTEEATY
jgi:hypothetical protein